MQIYLIAAGKRMPAWIEQGVKEFAQRMPPECRLKLIEIAAGKRGKGVDVSRVIRQEGELMLAAIPKQALVVALDVKGKQFSTPQLAGKMDEWLHGGRDVALLVGGPEGLAAECSARADMLWSLSALTFPHPLVRVIVAEQIYRAWSVLKNHPYHRE
jgi:23S rRNA (pseudouridine1915-N3)-methyltransferase